MNNDALAALQNGGEPPAPPEVVVPDAPVDQSDSTGQMNADDQADAAEWDKAADNIFPELKNTNEDKDGNGKTKSGQNAEENGTGEEAAQGEDGSKKPGSDNSAQSQKQNGEDGEHATKTGDDKADGGDGKDGEKNDAPEPTDASARLTAREQQAAVEAVKSEIREKMFKDVPTQLKDADGDPIHTIDDVMKHNNPRTGQPFTEEEAGLWLLQAQAQLRDSVSQINEQVQQIAETNLAIKDEADVINYEYGELLRAMPEIRQQLWEEYSKTFQTDPKSGVIVKAPVSLQRFYAAALEPYAALGRRLEADGSIQTPAAAQAPQQPQQSPQAQQQAKQQRRADRSDIYAAGKLDTATDEEKEWGAAAQAVFGDQLR
jgi:hypothetical protein